MLKTPKLRLPLILTMLACRVVAQVAAPATTLQGPVGYWKFDEGSRTTANDSSANGNPGTVIDARWAAGKMGGALDFTNGQGHVSTMHNIPLVSASVEFWIYPHANTGADSVILNYGNAGLDLRIQGDGTLSAAAGGVGLNARDLNFYASGKSDAWYHVAYTFDASAQKHSLYRNGVLVASGANSGAITPNGALWIGRNSQYDFGTFQGLLDEAKIYDRALSAAEVLADYQAGAGVSAPVILTFGANPTAIGPGQSTSLSWSTSGATSVSITPGASAALSPASGSLSVSPVATTTYLLMASNGSGSVTASATVTVGTSTDATSPSVPANVKATASSSSQISLSWAASTDNVGVAGYRITRNGARVGTTASTSYLDTGLSAGTTYAYTVVAYDAAGNTSAPSAPVSATTPSSSSTKPVISSFTANPNAMGAGQSSSLTWSSTGATSLSIMPKPGTISGDSGSVSVSPTLTTTYTLTATNAGGSVTASAVVTVGSDKTPPSAPTNVTATASSSTQILVSWLASTDTMGVAGYKVMRGGTQIGTSTVTSYLDVGLSAGTTYTYTVLAFDAAGNTSAASAPTSGTTSTSTPTSTAGNGIVISDVSGAGQTNRPFTISRVFVQGEFPAGSYPQARIGGTSVLTQADVKNTWPDGSLRHVMISFVATVPSNGNLNVDFIKQSSPNNTGFLDKTSMLNYNSGNWGADIEVTNGSTLKADARAMLTAWNGVDTGLNGLGVRYWLKGPVVTQVIVEDRSSTLQFDMGWDSYKPLHPIFVLTFHPNSGLGAKVEYILENQWTTKLEDQTYSLALKTGTSLNTTVYSKASFTQVSTSRWRKVFWSGTAPTGWTDEGHPGVNINYNLAYITASKAVPNYDLTKVVSSSAVAADVNGFNSSDRGDVNGSAMWLQYMPQTGGRPDIGPIPVWYVRYLYSMTPGMYAMMVGMAEVSGYVPFHLRESAVGKYYDSGRTIDAIGHPLSLDARPSIYLQNFNFSGTAPADQIIPVGNMTMNNWTVDLAHQPAFAYVPYLITGDWYFLEEVYFAAAHDLGVAVNGTNMYSRHDTWGWFNDQDIQTRGQAWGRRDIAEAAFVAPDGSPEKAYFTEKVNNNLAVEEGYQNTTSGQFYEACTSSPYDETVEKSKWCWGRNTVARGWPNPLHFGSMGNDSNVTDPKLVPQIDPNAPILQDAFYQSGYKLNVMGHIQELGFPAAGANAASFKLAINILANPSFNPRLINSDIIPTVAKSGIFYQDWGSLLAAYSTSFVDTSGQTTNLRTVNRFFDSASDDQSPDGYPHIWQAAASYTLGLSDGASTGAAAWNWTLLNVKGQAAQNDNPQYAINPR
jgi:chitodextrinase